MNGVEIIENLDSLWLFANVLASTTQPLACVRLCVEDEDVTHTHSNCSTPRSQPSKSMAPILNSQSLQFPDSQMEPQGCTRSGDLTVEVKEARKGGRKKRSKRKLQNRLGHERRVAFHELGFGGYNYSGCGSGMMKKSTCSYQRFGDQMPPFDDGMAMKEHLRLWAYAVACTVR